jgi:Fe2+ or Zn2+ uptake regulation protein
MEDLLNANARAILDVVRATQNHPTALEVYERVRLMRPRIGLATVYRILHQLSEQGLIKELGQNAGRNRYDGRTGRHGYAVYTTCGALLDIPMEISLSREVLQTAAQAAGITLGEHEVRLYGQCTRCQMETKETKEQVKI